MRKVLFAILDSVMILLMFFMVLMGQIADKWKAASQQAAAVPGMQDTIHGLKAENGKLTAANGGLNQQVGILQGENQGLRNENQKLENEKGGLTDSLGSLQAANRGLEQENEALADELGGTRHELGQVNRELSQWKSRFKSGPPLTLVVVPDVTGSQQPNIDSVRSCMEAIFKTLPKSSKDFRVGVLPFRNGLLEINGEVKRFPITQIHPRYEDEGASQDAVLSFLTSLRAVKSNTEHRSVFREAVKMLQVAHSEVDPKRRIRVVFTGDTGPAELDGVPGYSSEERQVKNQILQGMRQWAKDGNRGMVTFYTENEFTSKDPGAGESRQWFKDLGSISASSEFYTDTSELIIAINNASE